MARKAAARRDRTTTAWAQETADTPERPPAERSPREGWWGLAEHRRAGYVGLAVVLGAAIMAIGLLDRGQPHALMGAVGNALYALCGWGAYPLVAALLLGGVARVGEWAARRPLMRRTLPLQVLAFWLLTLGASHILLGGSIGGALGGLMANGLERLPWALGRVLAPVGIVVLAFAILGVTWGQVFGALGLTGRLLVASTARRMGRAEQPTVADERKGSAPGETGRERTDVEADAQPAEPASAAGRAAAAKAASPTIRPVPTPAVDEVASATSLAWSGNAGVSWVLPPLQTFEPAVPIATADLETQVERLARALERALRSLGVEAEVRREDIATGPTVIRLGVRPLESPKRDDRGRMVLDERGQPVLVRTRVSRILSLQPDLALALRVPSLRMEAPVPGQPYVGIEVPHPSGHPVSLREVLASGTFRQIASHSPLAVALGRDVEGRVRAADLARFPHVLIAGATGSGKSACLHSFICSILASVTPDDVRLMMIDPKLVELSVYNEVPHLLAPVVTRMDHVADVLQAALDDMERRYRLFAQLGVRSLEGYRRLREHRPELEHLPAVVIVVDELADVLAVAPRDAEELISRLAKLARAAGLHLVVATQRPTVDVVTGSVKANFATRIAFAVASAVDSRTILDTSGAEHLMGRGDMLFLGTESGRAERIQGAYVADEEIERVVAHWSAQAKPRLGAMRMSYRERSDDAPYHVSPDGWVGLDRDATIRSGEPGRQKSPGWSAWSSPARPDERR